MGSPLKTRRLITGGASSRALVLAFADSRGRLTPWPLPDAYLDVFFFFIIIYYNNLYGVYM